MNYEEKITINVTERLYNRITDDIRVYGKLKNNGEPNINDFLNTVISNYFDEYSDSYSDMIGRIGQVIGENEKGSRRKAQEIVRLMNMPRDTGTKQKTNRHIAVKPTKYSFNEDRLEEIDRISAEYGLSFSEYFRNMLESYFEMPQYKRERIYYKDLCSTIETAIRKQRALRIRTQRSSIMVYPRYLVSSQEELFNYLLAEDPEGKCYTFRISRIISAAVVNREVCAYRPENDEYFRQALKSPQYSGVYDDHICVELTEQGKNMFRVIYFDRPVPVRTEGNLYWFSGSVMQIRNYFSRFGKDAVIIEPVYLRKQLCSYYEEALNAYRKD
ncbi:MAG: WYL domain-containing protein [Solobacterium sp.]|nr:WYL domain-containing protein [Solobacterium sp.]